MFSCRFDVSEIELEVSAPIDHSTTSMAWDVFSILVQRDGLMDTRQQTRWLDVHALPSSQTVAKARAATKPPVQASDETGTVRSPETHRLFSPNELAHEQAAVEASYSTPEPVASPLLLKWAACNTACCVVDLRPIANSNPCRVEPKTNHPLVVSVIARTNGKVPGSPSSSPGRGTMNNSFDSASQSPKTDSSADTKKRPTRGRFGHYMCQVSCDFSEVFNAPTGRQEYRLRVKPQDVTCVHDAKVPGTPLYVRFTVTARKESLPTPAKMFYRNYHDCAILLDQFIVDLREKKRGSTAAVAPSAACPTSTLYRLGICVDTTNGIHKMKRFTLLFDGRAFPAPAPATTEGETDEITFIDFSTMAANTAGGLSMSSSFGPPSFTSSPQLVAVGESTPSAFAINSEPTDGIPVDSDPNDPRQSQDGEKDISETEATPENQVAASSPPASPLVLPASDVSAGLTASSPGLSPMRGSATGQGAADTVLIYSSNTTLFRASSAPKQFITFESRFKTDPANGLCKSSKKCQVAFSLFVTEGAHSTMHIMREEDLFDLSNEVLSSECFPEDGLVRSMKFPYGEILYFRVRRACFEAPKHYNMKQLSL